MSEPNRERAEAPLPAHVGPRGGSFRRRIVFALAAVAVAPVLLLGWSSFAVNRDEIERTVGGAQAMTAVELAQSCDRFVQEGLRALKLAATYIPFDSLAPGEMPGALAIPYRQLPAFDALVLLDASGAAVAEPVRHADPASDPALAGHEAVGDAALDAFARHVPFEAALSAPAAVGPPYRAPPAGAPRVAIAMRVGAGQRQVLAAELSLSSIGGRLEALAEAGAAGALVDARGEIVAGLAPEERLGADERALLAEGTRVAAPHGRVVRRADGERWLASFAPVPSLGWSVLVMRPEEQAFRAAERVRRYTVLWAALSLAVAGLLGAVLARDLAGPVSRLAAAARTVREGRRGARVAPGGGAELAALADAFNHMADEVERREEESRAWNAELQRRVEAQTAELRAADAQIARTRRLAGLASLGAGISHGINNPMTSLVGLVSLARSRAGADSEVGKLLAGALDESSRIARVVRDVRDLAEAEQRAAGVRFPLDGAVLAALGRRSGALAERRIELRTAVDGPLPAAQGTPEQIERLVEQLVDNAVAAMPGGGTLEVSLSSIDGQALRLCIADTGVGIAPEHHERIFDPFFTTRASAGAGLGLSLAHGIAEAHHGRIEVESEPGRGARFTVFLPAATPEAHLA